MSSSPDECFLTDTGVTCYHVRALHRASDRRMQRREARIPRLSNSSFLAASSLLSAFRAKASILRRTPSIPHRGHGTSTYDKDRASNTSNEPTSAHKVTSTRGLGYNHPGYDHLYVATTTCTWSQRLSFSTCRYMPRGYVVPAPVSV